MWWCGVTVHKCHYCLVPQGTEFSAWWVSLKSCCWDDSGPVFQATIVLQSRLRSISVQLQHKRLKWVLSQLQLWCGVQENYLQSSLQALVKISGLAMWCRFWQMLAWVASLAASVWNCYLSSGNSCTIPLSSHRVLHCYFIVHRSFSETVPLWFCEYKHHNLAETSSHCTSFILPMVSLLHHKICVFL